MKVWSWLAAACVSAACGCDKPGNSPTEPTGGTTANERPQLPADRQTRGAIVKAATFNFVGQGFADSRKWPSRVEDILPQDVEGLRVEPSWYRLAPPGDFDRPGYEVPVIYEASAPQEGGFVGYADGSMRWTSAAALNAELANAAGR